MNRKWMVIGAFIAVLIAGVLAAGVAVVRAQSLGMLKSGPAQAAM